MTWHAVQAALLVAALLTQHLWLRPRLRRRLAARAYALIVSPLKRRLRNAHAALVALSRAAHHRPYRPHHAPRTHP